MLPPRSSPVHTIRDSSTPPRGTGRRARPTRTTEHQDKQPETPLSELSETRPAAHSAAPTPSRHWLTGVRTPPPPMRTSRPSPVISIRTSIYAIPRKHQPGVPQRLPQNAVLFNSGHISFLGISRVSGEDQDCPHASPLLVIHSGKSRQFRDWCRQIPSRRAAVGKKFQLPSVVEQNGEI